ncbi:MAG: OmpH family outer membrane protein [Myxococcales bacterium]|nr:OmpH family outer membrane protein [Myxococcales bacterium]
MTVRILSLLTVLLLAFPLTAGAQDAASTRIGYVDLNRAIANVDDGEEALATLTGELEQRQARLDELQTQIESFTTQLEEEIMMLDEDERAARLQEYQEQIMAYQEMYVTNQQELSNLERQATAEILGRMGELVEELARERNLVMVLEKNRSAIVWAETELDLTDALISLYEERY